jgi:hypothetical protein
LIPKDIILCPWHYELHQSYPSIPLFLEKGFRVLPAGWRKVDATKALIQFGQRFDSSRLLGHLFTTWGAAKKGAVTQFQPMVEGLELLEASGK